MIGAPFRKSGRRVQFWRDGCQCPMKAREKRASRVRPPPVVYLLQMPMKIKNLSWGFLGMARRGSVQALPPEARITQNLIWFPCSWSRAQQDNQSTHLFKPSTKIICRSKQTCRNPRVSQVALAPSRSGVLDKAAHM